jgi:hypothetical protein
MTTRFSEGCVDHRGDSLPEGVYALVTARGDVVSYKARWREQDDNGVVRQRSKSFSGREPRSLQRARVRAIEQRDGARAIVRTGATVLRADSAARLTIGELFNEWITHYAATTPVSATPGTLFAPGASTSSPDSGTSRSARSPNDPGIPVRVHEDLQEAGVAISARRASLALLRSVLRWGRRRYPRVLTTDVSGLFQVPSYKRRRLIRATDPIAIERIIEAVLKRAHRDPLGPVRDAALVAAMGFTVAARPSEWLCYYAHVIARYRNRKPIGIEAEGKRRVGRSNAGRSRRPRSGPVPSAKPSGAGAIAPASPVP